MRQIDVAPAGVVVRQRRRRQEIAGLLERAIAPAVVAEILRRIRPVAKVESPAEIQ